MYSQRRFRSKCFIQPQDIKVWRVQRAKLAEVLQPNYAAGFVVVRFCFVQSDNCCTDSMTMVKHRIGKVFEIENQILQWGSRFRIYQPAAGGKSISGLGVNGFGPYL